jgi:hypothetical protein
MVKMSKKFSTKELIFIAVMSAFLFAVNFSIGSWVIVISGIPGSSVFVTGITNLIVVTFVALSLKRFGSITLLYFIYGILSLPTNMNGGPPGFVWKVPIMALTALSMESVFHFMGYTKKSFIFSLPALAASGLLLYLGAYYFLGMPEFETIAKVWLVMLVVVMIMGCIGIQIGFLLYNKLKDKPLLKQFT